MSVTSPFGTTTYGYDNNGNQTTLTRNGELITNNTYDKLNQLITSVTNNKTVTNVYDGDGLRVAKTANGATTKYLYEYDKVVLELDGSGNQTGRNVYGTNLLMRTADGTSYYYMYNGHADVTALLKPDGIIAATYYYDAFGITDTTGSANNNITFAGYQYDKETGLYYLNARMYDPKTARFLQEDTYLGDRNDPLSLNLYTYCHNEPIMYTDPTGHFDQLEAMARHASMLTTNSYFNGLTSTGSAGANNTEHIKASKAAYNQDKLNKILKEDREVADRINGSKGTGNSGAVIRMPTSQELANDKKAKIIQYIPVASTINDIKIVATGSDLYGHLKDDGEIQKTKEGLVIDTGITIMTAGIGKAVKYADDLVEGAVKYGDDIIYNGLKLDYQLFAKKDLKMVNDAAKQVGVDRNAFGEYIHELKADLGMKANQNFTWNELIEYAKDLKKTMGK